MDQFTYVQDAAGVIHLADESPLGGFVSGCDLVGEVTRVQLGSERVQMCPECLLDALSLGGAA